MTWGKYPIAEAGPEANILRGRHDWFDVEEMYEIMKAILLTLAGIILFGATGCVWVHRDHPDRDHTVIIEHHDVDHDHYHDDDHH